MNVVVTIPIYKNNPNNLEIASFRQCLKILVRYSIVVVTNHNVNLDKYIEVSSEVSHTFSVEYFDEKFFDGIWGYNELMLSELFYNRFRFYDYLLIYQLDAWVFKDDLLYWCEKDYDYIGAPWYEFLQPRVGNGGLSLRKISTFNEAFHSHKLFYSLPSLAKNVKFNNIKSWIKFLFQLAGYHNTFTYYKHLWSKVFEDQFWCRYLYGSQYQLKIPDICEASLFSIDYNPQKMYEQNGCVLPFGCHGINKAENIEFWKKYIEF